MRELASLLDYRLSYVDGVVKISWTFLESQIVKISWTFLESQIGEGGCAQQTPRRWGPGGGPDLGACQVRVVRVVRAVVVRLELSTTV